MKWLMALVLVCLFPLVAAAQEGGGWAPAAMGAAAAEAPAEDVTPATETGDGDVAARLAEARKATRLNWRQRRAMGLTFSNLRKVTAELNEAGELEGLSRSGQAMAVFNELVDDNPQMYLQPGIDIDAIIQFIEAILPLILTIIDLFSLHGIGTAVAGVACIA
ncbi:MAG: hypothetical protein R6U98_17785 [Pirellulaceae bacterium]